MSSIFNLGYYPKKSAANNGAVALAIAIEAKTAKLAEMKATMLLEESNPGASDNFFKPKICADRVGVPRPTIDSFSAEWMTHNQWNETEKCFEPIPLSETDSEPSGGAKKIFDLSTDVMVAYILMYGADPDTVDKEHLSNAYDLLNDDEAQPNIRAILDGLPRVLQVKSMPVTSVEKLIETLQAKSPPFTSWPDVKKFGENWVIEDSSASNGDISSIIDLIKVSPRERFASVLLFGNAQIDGNLIAQVREYLSDLDSSDANDDEEEDRLNRFILSAMASHGPLNHMHADGLYNMLQGLSSHFENQQPGRSAIYQFIKNWADHPDKRDEMVKPITSTSTDVERTTSGASAGVPNRSYPHTLDSLDCEAAAALLPMDFDINKIPTAIHRRAKEVVANKESPWMEWSAMFRKTPGILEFSREQIFDLIRSANPDLHHFPTSHREYINANLGRQTAQTKSNEPEVKNLGGGTFSVEGLTGEQQNVASKEPESDTKAPAPETKVPVAATESVNVELQTADTAVTADMATAHDELQNRADELERDLASKTGSAAENLAIWKQVQRTDPARTKLQEFTNGKGEVTRIIVSPRPVYQYMRATEIFGPFGIGWGVDVVEERFDRGIPLMEAIFDNAGRETGKKVMRDGDGSIMTSLNHTMKITLWYVHGGQRGEITAYGHTKALYSSKFGLTVEEEPSKKSLTDATTKALSSLGFSADVYLGLFEDAEYSQENAREHGIKNATDKAEDSVRLRKELDDRFTTNTETMRAAVTKNEVTQIASSLTRTIAAHIKSAKAVGDAQHAKYLESRLHRLEEIKNECLAKFDTEKQA